MRRGVPEGERAKSPREGSCSPLLGLGDRPVLERQGRDSQSEATWLEALQGTNERSSSGLPRPTISQILFIRRREKSLMTGRARDVGGEKEDLLIMVLMLVVMLVLEQPDGSGNGATWWWW